MKKLFIVLVCMFFTSSAYAFDYVSAYNNLQEADFSYIHGYDPDQYFDMQNYAYTPYPLFRLNSPMYFKKKPIEPGYYLLTPREHNGKWYVLFKENGKVKYYIPCYNRDIVPLGFYEANLPKPKLTFTQKVHIKFIEGVGKISKSSKRRSAPKTFLEADDLDNEYTELTIYYGDFRYHILLRTNPN